MGAYQSHFTVQSINNDIRNMVAITPSDDEVQSVLNQINTISSNATLSKLQYYSTTTATADSRVGSLYSLVLLMRNVSAYLAAGNDMYAEVVLDALKAIGTIAPAAAIVWHNNKSFAALARQHPWMLGDVYQVALADWDFENGTSALFVTVKALQAIYSIDYEYWFLLAIDRWNEVPVVSVGMIPHSPEGDDTDASETLAVVTSRQETVQRWMSWCMVPSVMHRLRTSGDFAEQALSLLNPSETRLIDTVMFQSLINAYRSDLGYMNNEDSVVTIASSWIAAELFDAHFVAHVIYPEIFTGGDASAPERHENHILLIRYIQTGLEAGVTLEQMKQIVAPTELPPGLDGWLSGAFPDPTPTMTVIKMASEFGRSDIMEGYGFGTPNYRRLMTIQFDLGYSPFSTLNLLKLCRFDIYQWVFESLQLSPREQADLQRASEMEARFTAATKTHQRRRVRRRR